MGDNFYQFSPKSLQGKFMSMHSYEGKVSCKEIRPDNLT